MQNLDVSYATLPEQYTYTGRITSPGASFVLTAGASPKFSVARSSAGVYVVSLFETPVLFLGADLTIEGAITPSATATVTTTGYVYAPASGATKATVTFYTANVTNSTTLVTAAADLPFCFQIFCADTNKVA